MLCLATLATGLWAGRRQAIRRIDPRRSTITNAMPAALTVPAINLAARRSAGRAVSHAVLHGRIDQPVGLSNGWNPNLREQVQGHVAAVMRAGLRRGDSYLPCDDEHFTITIPGADERTAERIADRLRRSLAKLQLPHLSGSGRVTASFGVAAEQFGDTGDALMRRAQRALNAALAQGTDHIIAASEIDEVILLPAPAADLPKASAA